MHMPMFIVQKICTCKGPFPGQTCLYYLYIVWNDMTIQLAPKCAMSVRNYINNLTQEVFANRLIAPQVRGSTRW